MRHLRWLPFAFLAGQHGFAIFAPYAALMMMVSQYIELRRRRSLGAATITPAPAGLPEPVAQPA